MAARKYTTARSFSPVDLGNGKSYTPERAETGRMEYRMELNGQPIGYATSPDAARLILDEVVAEQARQLATDLADEAAERDAQTERDILDTDLAALRAAVESNVTIGALAALVSSGCYLWRRGLLVDQPHLADWTAARQIAQVLA